MLKNLILAASAVLFLTGCDPFEGLLTVNKQPLVVKGEKPVTIPVGQYTAKLEMPSKKEIQIKLKIADKDTKIKIKTATELNIPDNGDFLISAATLNQDFHAAGHADTVSTTGPVNTGYQSCTYQRRETRCFTNPQGQVVCRDYWVTVNGQQFVEYQDRQTDKKIKVGFYRDSSGYLANFAGEKSYTERLIRYQGQCY